MNNFNTNKGKTNKVDIGTILKVVITVTLTIILITVKYSTNAKPVSSEDSEIYKVIDEFDVSGTTKVITIEDKESDVQYMIVTYRSYGSVSESVSIAISPRIQYKTSRYLR